MAFGIKVNRLGSRHQVDIMWLEARGNMQSLAFGSSRNTPPLRDRQLKS